MSLLEGPQTAIRSYGPCNQATCELYPTRASTGFKWRWRTNNRRSRSKQAFPFFYECVMDAVASGHTVDLTATLIAARQYQAKLTASSSAGRNALPRVEAAA